MMDSLATAPESPAVGVQTYSWTGKADTEAKSSLSQATDWM